MWSYVLTSYFRWQFFDCFFKFPLMRWAITAFLMCEIDRLVSLINSAVKFLSVKIAKSCKYTGMGFSRYRVLHRKDGFNERLFYMSSFPILVLSLVVIWWGIFRYLSTQKWCIAFLYPLKAVRALSLVEVFYSKKILRNSLWFVCAMASC